MTIQYPLEQLGSTGFQDLAAALAIIEFGPQVQAMGAGADGGRDMYARGRLVWGTGPDAEVWDGLSVFQVKHKDRISDRPQADATWLWGELKSELDDWSDPRGKREVPDYVVLVTNVPLTPVPGSGGHDSLIASIRNYIDQLRDDSRDIDEAAARARELRLSRLEKIKAWRFWDRNQVSALLTAHERVRTSFAAFLTAQDVFSHLSQFTSNLPVEELRGAVQRHSRSNLLGGDSVIYFDEAGDDVHGLPINKVAVDLPVAFANGDQRSTALRHVTRRAEHVLRPSQSLHRKPRHVVLTGAPGNGKTTLSKYIAHLFRCALIDGAADLAEEQASAIRDARDSANRLGIQFPLHRRWPFRVDLAEYAAEGAVVDQQLLVWIS